MTIPSWLRSLKSLLRPSPTRGPRRTPTRHRPALEPLEDRIVPALGDSLAEAGFSAKHILAARPGVPSGAYWIDPTGGSHADAFQAYCDMVTDGGGWILAVNSVLGSEAATNDINANTGTVGLTTGHTRNVAVLASSQEGQLRHEIDASNQGQGVYHARFNGNHSRRMEPFGAWTTLPGHTNPNLLNAHFGEAFFAFGAGFEAFGAPWYYPGGGPTFSAIPATPVNGTSGPAINSNPGQLINAYRIWVREVAAPTSPHPR
jgi:hypothetical protein